MNKPTKIITHHAVSGTGHTAEDVSQWHYERWGGYSPSRRGGNTAFAGYHFIVEYDGTVVQCRDLNEEGIHCKGQNFNSIGVCFMGNNDIHYPSLAQREAWQQVFARIRLLYPKITPNDVYPHRKYANKSCHGSLLSNDYWTLQLGATKKATVRALQQQVVQLMNQLLVLLTKERMRG